MSDYLDYKVVAFILLLTVSLLAIVFDIVPVLVVATLSALASVQNAAKQKNIQIKKEMGENISGIKADADKTTWVLNNFLTNAIRYSADNAEIIISIQQQDNKVQFSVKDFGKGIDPQYKDKIFDRYFKIPGTKEGTGLGLAICKEFIEAQQGTIWMESIVDKGTRFGFELPVV